MKKFLASFGVGAAGGAIGAAVGTLVGFLLGTAFGGYFAYTMIYDDIHIADQGSEMIVGVLFTLLTAAVGTLIGALVFAVLFAIGAWVISVIWIADAKKPNEPKPAADAADKELGDGK